MGQPGIATPLRSGVLRYHAVAFAVTFAAVWGSLAGGANHLPARASAPASLALPDASAAGLNVRPGSLLVEPPSAGAGLQLTVAAQCRDRRAATVAQSVGAP